MSQPCSGPATIPVNRLGSVVRSLNFEAVTPAVHATQHVCAQGADGHSSSAKTEHAHAIHVPSAQEVEKHESPPAMHVVLRIRPLSEKEVNDNVASCVERNKKNDKVVSIRPKNLKCLPPAVREQGKAMFRFAHIFDENDTQSDVFDQTTLPMIEGLFRGHSAVVFAYGVTCSGKTWTIQGSAEHPGVLPRALDVIVNSIAVAKGAGLLHESTVSDGVAALTMGKTETGRRRRIRDRHASKQKVHDSNYLDVSGAVDYKIFASYLEIYNEQCFDLFDKFSASGMLDEYSHVSEATAGAGGYESAVKLEPSEHRRKPRQKRPVLKLREGADGEVYADGLTEVEINNGADIDSLLEFGQNNRSVAQTSANEGSSRSHAVFFITLKQVEIIPQDGGHPKIVRKSSRLCIVDLAGSERTSKTNNRGLRLREANQINSSLMSLGRCLKVMRDNEQLKKLSPRRKPYIVPFRESRLTRLLQHSLQAGSAVMIANVSPAMYDANETVQALRCAKIAREVFAASSKRSAPPRDLSNALQVIDRNVGPRGDQTAMVGKATSSNPAPRSMRTRVQTRRQKAGTPRNTEKNQIDMLKEENIRLKKENTFLAMERDEERCARIDAEKICNERENDLLQEHDALFRQNEKLRDCLADAEARVILAEREVREEVVDEAQQIIQQLQENYQKQLDEAHGARSSKSSRASLICGRERRENAERLANRVAMRVSRAAFDDIKMRLADDVRLSTQNDEHLDLTSDDEDYIEEE